MRKKNYLLTPEQELEVIKIYTEQTISAENIGRMYNVSERPILAILKRHNIRKKTTLDHMASENLLKNIDLVIKEYKSGVTISELVRKFGSCKITIKRILRKSGIKIRTREDNRKIKTIENNKIIELYSKDYLSTEEIAIIYNVSHGTILTILWNSNVEMRRFGEGSKLFTPTEEKEICNKYLESNISMVELSDIYKCAPTVIKCILKRNNIKIRKISIYKECGSWGISGHYNGEHFRSMNELSYMINHLEYNNIPYLCENRCPDIKYFDSQKNKERTYNPDFFVNSKTIVEIKPAAFWKRKNVLDKAKYAIEFCERNNLKYEMIDYPVKIEPIIEKYLNGKIKFSKTGTEKFTRIYKKYLN